MGEAQGNMNDQGRSSSKCSGESLEGKPRRRTAAAMRRRAEELAIELEWFAKNARVNGERYDHLARARVRCERIAAGEAAFGSG
ncbi:MAG: hypothetical protein ACF8PN_07830 [Phycisphaerales bacterium]